MALSYGFFDAWSKWINNSKYTDHDHINFRFFFIVLLCKLVVLCTQTVPLSIIVITVCNLNSSVAFACELLNNTNIKNIILLFISKNNFLTILIKSKVAFIHNNFRSTFNEYSNISIWKSNSCCLSFTSTVEWNLEQNKPILVFV
jgi:hypothetical protein